MALPLHQGLADSHHGVACGTVVPSTRLFEAPNSNEIKNRFGLMQNQRQINRVKLVAILLVAGLALFAHSQRSVGATQDQAVRLFEFAGMDMPLEKRVGVDDGAAFVVHFGGDTRGSLDSCG
jgi:hypothetical protein